MIKNKFDLLNMLFLCAVCMLNTYGIHKINKEKTGHMKKHKVYSIMCLTVIIISMLMIYFIVLALFVTWIISHSPLRYELGGF